MSWLFSQALVAAYSADTCSDGALSVQSNGNPIPQAYCASDKMTAFSRLSRFGMTFAPLTESRGADLLTWYLAAFPARTSAQPEKVPASKASAVACGNKWQESSMRYDLATSSWKTHRCLWDEDLPWSSVILPKWGMTRNGQLYQHQTLERPISGTESGFMLPTPVASDGTSGAIIGKNDTFYTTSTGMPRKVNQNGKDGSVGLGRLVQMWPTPKANDAEKRGNFDLTNPRNGLPAAVKKKFPTPSATDGMRGGTMTENMTGQSLTQMVNSMKFATPQARDFRSGQESRWDNPNRTRNLNDQIAKFPTASANDWKGSSKEGQRRGQLTDPAMGVIEAGGQLNPTWVEWLMGWPLGWTDLKPLAMDRYQQWLQQHGGF